MKEACLYEPRDNHAVRCRLCNHMCNIMPGARGKCGVRENQGGKLYSLVYGKLIALNVDPIEKKPLFHFLPGSLSYSIATAGCNFTCRFCQNSDISQMPSDTGLISGRPASPEQIVLQTEAADAPASQRAVDKGRSALVGLRPFSTARDRASLVTCSSLRLGVFARDISFPAAGAHPNAPNHLNDHNDPNTRTSGQ